MRKLFSILLIALATFVGVTVSAFSAGDAHKPVDVDWSWEGFFGSYDRSQLQRGLKVYQTVCASCHSLDYVAFRNLTDIGFTEEEAAAIADDYTVMDGPDDTGEMYEREGRLPDHFPAPFDNEQMARMANNGALPPDLSLMVKARANGADYVYSLLTGYEEPPADVTLRAGMNYNPYFASGQIAMAQPLYDDMVEYTDGTAATVEQMSQDVVAFLAWAAEPKLEDRKHMGFKVLIYMAILTILLYLANRKVWAAIKKKKK